MRETGNRFASKDARKQNAGAFRNALTGSDDSRTGIRRRLRFEPLLRGAFLSCSGGCPAAARAVFRRGPFQGQEQNADVVVEEVDGVAGVFPQLLLERLRLEIP